MYPSTITINATIKPDNLTDLQAVYDLCVANKELTTVTKDDVNGQIVIAVNHHQDVA